MDAHGMDWADASGGTPDVAVEASSAKPDLAEGRYPDPGPPPELVRKGKGGFTLYEADGTEIVSHIAGLYLQAHDGFSQILLQQPTAPLTQKALASYYISVLLPGTFVPRRYDSVVGGRLEFRLADERVYSVELPSPEAQVVAQVQIGVPTGTLYDEKVSFTATLTPANMPPLRVEFY